MMRLSTMRGVVETLDEKGRCAVAEEILAHWDSESGSARFLRASANFVFTFEGSGRGRVLRFNHSSERAPEPVRSEIAYVNHLATGGIRVARPVRSLSGDYVVDARTTLGRFQAVVFEELAGRQLGVGEMTPEMLAAWGEALGKLHEASRGYSGRGRRSWRDDLVMVAENLPPGERAARKTLRKLEERLGLLPIDDRNFGLIYFDFETDNIIWNEGRPGVVDFDDSAQYWIVADIAFALRDLFDDDPDAVDPNNEAFVCFMDGYCSVRELEPDELGLVPTFLRMHNLLTFAKLHRALGANGPHDGPPWLEGLREKLSARMESYREGFLRYAR